jgi:dihydrofolate reductase/thymidylate synthase
MDFNLKNKFNVILATSINNVLGLNNDLPWKKDYPDELKYFKKITEYSENDKKNVLIMGRKTFQSLPSLLSNRIHIVISSSFQCDKEDVYIVNSFDDAVNLALELNNNGVFVVGGKSIYTQAFNHYLCGKIYHTIINKHYDGDVFLELNNYNIISEFQKEGLNFRILELKGEYKYLQLLSKIKNKGELRDTRNGKTFSIFDETLVFDLNDGFPLLTTKKMFWKGIVEELLFFIRGSTNSKLLEEKGVNIWKWNTTKEFLNKCNLDYQEGDMGPMYGWQWRHFGAEYVDCNYDYNNNYNNNINNGYDQLKKLIEEIKIEPNSRRLIMTDFNPSQSHLGVLYPCHSIVLQFYVNQNRLEVKMYQRSVDSFLGLPFNIASTSLLLLIIAKLCNYDVGRVIITMGDIHIYQSHLNQINTQLERESLQLCKVEIPDFKSLEEVEQSKLEDYKLINYISNTIIKAEMVT